MNREDQTDVLVVGAGPVGMLTAFLLAESGIRVKIIDQEDQTAGHSYACALHPGTLKILDQIGLATEALKLSRYLSVAAFYEGAKRRAEIKLSGLPLEFPYVATLPQSALEDLLEQKLRQKENVSIHWNHRLSALRSEREAVVASIDKLGKGGKGYAVPEFETVVEKTVQTRAAFVVGADGQNSLVRQCLGIECERVGPPETFTTYEFGWEGDWGHEVRIVLDDRTSNILLPLPGNQCRWTFQHTKDGESSEFPSKDRMPWYVVEQESDHDSRHDLQSLIAKRAPWFSDKVGELDWSAHIRFERRLAKRFGLDRCWLAGDAAHQTSPIGVQSMNAGMREAEELSRALGRILNEKAPLESLEAYNRTRRQEWEKLLGITPFLQSRNETSAWVKQHCKRILPCIPASGEDLALLVNQLGLQWQ
jgi:NADPH-dependent dioxygenase